MKPHRGWWEKGLSPYLPFLLHLLTPRCTRGSSVVCNTLHGFAAYMRCPRGTKKTKTAGSPLVQGEATLPLVMCRSHDVTLRSQDGEGELFPAFTLLEVRVSVPVGGAGA